MTRSRSQGHSSFYHNFDDVCSALELAGHPVTGKKGAGYNGKGQCCCLLHDDTNPSMGVAVENGKLLVNCLAGCDKGALFTRAKEIVGPGSPSNPIPKLSVVPTTIKPIRDFTPKWENYTESDDLSKYTYCTSKGVKAHGLRLSPRGNDSVPMRTNGGTGGIVGIHEMNAEYQWGTRNKHTLDGSAKDGSAHIIGDLKDGCKIIVCEGYATAATVYEATGIVSACAFGEGNLIKVAEELSAQGHDVIVSPDDDKAGHKVRDNAQAMGIRVILPSFEGIESRGAKDNDWNDLMGFIGPVGIKKQIESGLIKPLPVHGDDELTYDDKGNVRRLLAHYPDHVRYLIDLDIWMTFDPQEGRWVQGPKPAFDRMQDACAKSLSREIRDLKAQGQLLHGDSKKSNEQKIEDAERHQSKCRRSNSISASLIFASSDKRLQAKLDDFDSPLTYHLINFRNGTFDIKEGTIRSHNPKDMITQSTGYDYDPKADQSEIVSMIETMFPDPDTRKFVQVFAGYQLIAMNPEKKLLILYGVTANNGKSTLQGAFIAAGGEYSSPANVEVILEKQKSSGGHNESLARIRGKRAIFLSELPENGKLNENQVKSVTGNDSIAASRKNEKELVFTFVGTVMVGTNNKPNVSSCAGMWQRLLLLPCNYKYEKADPTIVDRLSNAKAGTMNWLLEGARIYLNEGLCIPKEVEDATNEYKVEQCVVQRWADLNVKEASAIDLPLADAYDHYTKWITAEGDRPITKKAFSLELSRLGMKPIPSGRNQRIVFVNRALRDD